MKINESPTGEPVLVRTYTRFKDSGRESFEEVVDRVVEGADYFGKFTEEERQLIENELTEQRAFPSGRWLWVGGTDWIKQPKNAPGAFNCSATPAKDIDAFGIMMDFGMMGCGTGTDLQDRWLEQLPKVVNKLKVNVKGTPGKYLVRQENTIVNVSSCMELDGYVSAEVIVGDSREGWVTAMQSLIELACDNNYTDHTINITVDVNGVRGDGEPIKGFGGVANPIQLSSMFIAIERILNECYEDGGIINYERACLLFDEASLAVVAGNVRRSASMRQFDVDKPNLKLGLWKKGEDGLWSIDPTKTALRMGNHTKVYHDKPSYEDILAAVQEQVDSGEGAIMYAPEAVARANADLIKSPEDKQKFIDNYCKGNINDYLKELLPNINEYELMHRANRYQVNPCGEIIGYQFLCNLSTVHLNNISAVNLGEQARAFRAAALFAAALLHMEFDPQRVGGFYESRLLDPIVGVSTTGLFDFFVTAFGVQWLKWWEAGRPDSWIVNDLNLGEIYIKAERSYLSFWRDTVEHTVKDYCSRHGLVVPNRMTTQQPSGSQSCLTNASSGCHPPKALQFIRRVTFTREDPVALACIDYGYNVVPSQSCTDENGNLLDDPFDPRVTEWLVEFPTTTSWANLPGVQEIQVEKFSAVAQLKFFMQVQNYYVGHTVSSTTEARPDEVEELATYIHSLIENDKGYVSTAILGRFEVDTSAYPRLPFEPITRHRYLELHEQVLARRKTDNFLDAVRYYDSIRTTVNREAGPSGCDSDKCLIGGPK